MHQKFLVPALDFYIPRFKIVKRFLESAGVTARMADAKKSERERKTEMSLSRLFFFVSFNMAVVFV